MTIPDAEILSVDLDEDSMGEPLTDTGFMTKITKVAEAQNTRKKSAKEMELFQSERNWKSQLKDM